MKPFVLLLMIALFFVSVFPTRAAITDGVILLHSFDNTTMQGTEAKDYFGYNNLSWHGTMLVNQTGYIGQAVTTSATAWLEAQIKDPLPQMNNASTISFLAKPAGTAQIAAFCMGDATWGNNAINLEFDSGTPNRIGANTRTYNAWNNIGISYNSAWANGNTWQLFTLALDGINHDSVLWINVTNVSSASGNEKSHAFTSGGEYLYLGNNPDALNGAWSFDELVIWNRTLTQAEISQYWSYLQNGTSMKSLLTGAAPPPTFKITAVNNITSTSITTFNATMTWAALNVPNISGLVAYYPFEEGSGSTVLDASGNEYNGLNKNISLVTYSTGKVGDYALDFAGVQNGSGWVNTTLNVNTSQSFSIGFWFYPRTLNEIKYIINDRQGSSALVLDTGSSGLLQFIAWNQTGQSITLNSAHNLAALKWYFVVAMYNSTAHEMKIYLNGTLDANNTNSFINDSQATVALGRDTAGAYRIFNGSIDDVMIFNKALTADEVLQIYNWQGGYHLNSSFYSTTNGTINTPYNSSGGLLNITLMTAQYYTALVANYNTSTNLEARFNPIPPAKPTVNVYSPISGGVYVQNLNANVSGSGNLLCSLNFTMTHSNGSIVYRYDNASYSGYNNITITPYVNLTLLSGVLKSNATFCSYFGGLYNCTEVTFYIFSINQSTTFSTPVLEDSSNTYALVMNYNSTYVTSILATLNYNNTYYSTTPVVSGGTITFSSSLTTPHTSAGVSLPLYFNVTINGIQYNMTAATQIIYPIGALGIVNTTCAAGLSPAMCWSFKEENNLSTIIPESVDYNFAYGIVNSSYVAAYGTLNFPTQLCLCINSTIYNNYTLGSGELKTRLTGYTERSFFTFSTQRLSNTTINNTIYLLANGLATSFLFDFKDTNLNPYTEKYISLLRWYPGLNQYNVVEMGKTDEKGQGIMRVKVEDTDYRVGLYEQDGTLIKLLNPVRFACLDSPCTYSTFFQDESADYVEFDNVQTNIDYNSTSGVWLLTWNDPSQNTKSMSLLVTKDTVTSYIVLCNSSATGFTGVIQCSTPNATGILRARVYRTASPARIIASKIYDAAQTVFKSGVGLFISLIIFLCLALIGVFSPPASIILGVVALVPAYFLGAIHLPVLIGIAVIGMLVIHFMKRT